MNTTASPSVALQWNWTLDHATALQAAAFPGTQEPGVWRLNLQPLQSFDSSALALLLHWRRQAQQKGADWQVEQVPAGLLDLAQVYGVDEWLGLKQQPAKS